MNTLTVSVPNTDSTRYSLYVKGVFLNKEKRNGYVDFHLNEKYIFVVFYGFKAVRNKNTKSIHRRCYVLSAFNGSKFLPGINNEINVISAGTGRAFDGLRYLLNQLSDKDLNKLLKLPPIEWQRLIAVIANHPLSDAMYYLYQMEKKNDNIQ